MMIAPTFSENPLPDEERTTPAGKPRATKVLCVKFGPGVKPILSVQREFNLTSGIRRGLSDYAGRLIMDHVVGPTGLRLFGNEMRLGTISVWEHQLRVAGQLGDRNIAAIVGNGNLTQNPYFIGWFGNTGELVRIAGEPATDRDYDCFTVARGDACSMRCLRFRPQVSSLDLAGWRALQVEGNEAKDVSASLEFAFSGQRIVVGGESISHDDLNRGVLAGLFYDLRHVFRFPAVSAAGYWKDIGIEQFYNHGTLLRATVGAALAEEPIRTPWRDLTDNVAAVRKAFGDKGYRESFEGALNLGEYRIDGQYVHIVYLPAIYCHNVLGISRGGDVMSMQVTGWSNNAGATLRGLARIAAKVFQDAILVDNGGDVFFIANPNRFERPLVAQDDIPTTPATAWVESCEKRYNVRSAVLFAAMRPGANGDLTSVELPS